MALVVFNQKGGVGKSTITCNLAAISASQGLRTLVIDLDVQGNSSAYLLGHAPRADQPSVVGFFEQTLGYSFTPPPPTDFIVRTPFENLDLIASGPQLDELQSKLESRHKIYKLREALQQLASEYERIYIDTPPALNFYTRSALMGASGCLIPFELYRQLHFIGRLMQTRPSQSIPGSRRHDVGGLSSAHFEPRGPCHRQGFPPASGAS